MKSAILFLAGLFGVAVSCFGAQPQVFDRVIATNIVVYATTGYPASRASNVLNGWQIIDSSPANPNVKLIQSGNGFLYPPMTGQMGLGLTNGLDCFTFSLPIWAPAIYCPTNVIAGLATNSLFSVSSQFADIATNSPAGIPLADTNYTGAFYDAVNFPSGYLNAPSGTLIGGGTLIPNSATAGTTDAAIVSGYGNQLLGTAGAFSVITSMIGAGEQNIIENGTACFIGGGQINYVGTNDPGIIVSASAIGGGEYNVVSGNFGFIGGGQLNKITSVWGTIGGGWSNSVASPAGTIAGGDWNLISDIPHPGGAATIGGGSRNKILVRPDGTTISGGEDNVATNADGTISGGVRNLCGGINGVICGGSDNTNLADQSVILGGVLNKIAANATYSAAFGWRANVQHVGTLVWSDTSVSADYTSTAANMVQFRAANGLKLDGGNFQGNGIALTNQISGPTPIANQVILWYSNTVLYATGPNATKPVLTGL